MYAPGDTTRRCSVTEGRCGKHQARDRDRRYACPYPRESYSASEADSDDNILLYS